MGVAPDSLALNGGSITSEATGVNADLSHNGTLVMGTIDDIGTRGDGSGGKGDLEGNGPVVRASNHAAAGIPIIAGTVQVGETLSVDTSGISDTDGIVNSILTYQWIANDGTEDTDIQDATGSGVESASLQRYFPATSSQYSLLMPTNRLPSDRSQAGPATQGYWWRLVGPVPLRRSSIRRAKGSPRHGPSTQRTVSCDCLDCQSQYAPPQMSQTGCSVFQRSYALPIDTHGIIRFSMSSTSLVES